MTITVIGAEPRFFALVPCAGSGSRAGSDGPKQYTPVAGRPLVAHTLAALANLAHSIKDFRQSVMAYQRVIDLGKGGAPAQHPTEIHPMTRRFPPG